MSNEKDWWPTFFACLRNSGNVREASIAAGVNRSTVYRTRQRLKGFQLLWDEALDDACDLLVEEARKRALAGSDLLLIFLLKAHRPELYSDRIRHELAGKDGGRLTFTLELGEPRDGLLGPTYRPAALPRQEAIAAGAE